MNKAMRTQLGRIQIYGSINRYFFFIDILCFCTWLTGPCCGDRPDEASGLSSHCTSDEEPKSCCRPCLKSSRPAGRSGSPD
jgi:hypothetical protein